ncbi:hypothetical protein MHEI_32580 [Mycobacterium heidelbergense]|nr:hypothetical protein MHEI_32580 [Mycobacterium heidelbergense]
MVESTMIMKKPIIIAQSACQGFAGRARRVPPGDRGVAVVMHPPRFSVRTVVSGPARSHSSRAGHVAGARGPRRRKALHPVRVLRQAR